MGYTSNYEIRLYNSDGNSEALKLHVATDSQYNNFIVFKICYNVIVGEFCRRFFAENLTRFIDYFDIYLSEITSVKNDYAELLGVLTDNDDIPTIEFSRFYDGHGTRQNLTEIIVKKGIDPKATVYHWKTDKYQKAVTFRRKLVTNNDLLVAEIGNFKVILNTLEWYNILQFIRQSILSHDKKGSDD